MVLWTSPLYLAHFVPTEWKDFLGQGYVDMAALFLASIGAALSVKGLSDDMQAGFKRIDQRFDTLEKKMDTNFKLLFEKLNLEGPLASHYAVLDDPSADPEPVRDGQRVTPESLELIVDALIMRVVKTRDSAELDSIAAAPELTFLQDDDADVVASKVSLRCSLMDAVVKRREELAARVGGLLGFLFPRTMPHQD
jgi:hypothetical protein